MRIDEAFAGGLMYGLSLQYPMNLCMAVGINVGLSEKDNM